MADRLESMDMPKQEGQDGSSEDLKTESASGGGRWRLITEDMNNYFKKGLFILVGIFIIIAAFGLYFSINNIIDRWVEYQYVPLAQTIYYIFVIALGLYLMRIYILKK
jgi:hypothetical protein